MTLLYCTWKLQHTVGTCPHRNITLQHYEEILPICLHDPSPGLLKNMDKSRYSDPSSSAGVRGIDHSMVDKTALHRLLWGKYTYVNVETYGTLPTTHHLKYIIFGH
jgi:hypothetical protein